LALLGCLYVLGYAVWSVHAYHRGLGFLPAIRAQYLVAGLVPLLLIVLFALTAWGLVLLHRKGPEWTTILILCLLSPPAILTVLFGGSTGKYALYPILVAGVAVLALGLIALVSDLTSRPRITYVSYLALLLAISFGIFGVAGFLYVRVVYERIPEELGGVASHCQTLYLKRDHLASELADDLVDSVSANSNGNVVPTTPVRVLFVGSDNTRFRLKDKDSALYSIENDAIAGSKSC
jgi:hypothetical protein